jgi:hypothetical protein
VEQADHNEEYPQANQRIPIRNERVRIEGALGEVADEPDTCAGDRNEDAGILGEAACGEGDGEAGRRWRARCPGPALKSNVPMVTTSRLAIATAVAGERARTSAAPSSAADLLSSRWVPYLRWCLAFVYRLRSVHTTAPPFYKSRIMKTVKTMFRVPLAGRRADPLAGTLMSDDAMS